MQMREKRLGVPVYPRIKEDMLVDLLDAFLIVESS